MLLEDMIWLCCLMILIIPAVFIIFFIMINIISIWKKKQQKKKIARKIIIIIVLFALLTVNIGAIIYTYYQKEPAEGFTALDAKKIADGIPINGTLESPLIRISSGDNWENGFSDSWSFIHTNYSYQVFENGSYAIHLLQTNTSEDFFIRNWTIDSDEAYEKAIEKHSQDYHVEVISGRMSLSYSPSDETPIWEMSFSIPYGVKTYFVNARNGEFI